jgi:hypothetical protein
MIGATRFVERLIHINRMTAMQQGGNNGCCTEYIGHSKTVRVFDEMTSDQIAALPPEQIPIASAILANENSLMENRRVAALLQQCGLQDTAQDVDA